MGQKRLDPRAADRALPLCVSLSSLRLTSVFGIRATRADEHSSVTVTWQSVAGVRYLLECSTNLSAIPRFTPLATSLPGQPGTTTYIDTNAIGAGPFFYRVGVGN